MKAIVKVHRLNKARCVFVVFLQAAAFLLFPDTCRPADLPVIKGIDYNPLIVNSERLYGRKIIIQDLMADHKRTFTKLEKRRGFKEYYYVKFVLRDSKLAGFVCRYDYKDMESFKEIRKGDRVTIVGYIERLGVGVKRFVNPKFVIRVDDIMKGWKMSDEEAVLDIVSDQEPITYREVSPEDLANLPEGRSGEYVRVRDRFSLISTFFTNFEKDLDLSNATTIKFRGELLPWAYYLPRDEETLGLLSGLKNGEKITVFGKVVIRPIPDDQLVLLSAHSIRKGWD